MDIISQGLPLLTILCNSICSVHEHARGADRHGACHRGCRRYNDISNTFRTGGASNQQISRWLRPRADQRHPFQPQSRLRPIQGTIAVYNNSDRLFILSCPYVRRVAYQRQFVIM